MSKDTRGVGPRPHGILDDAEAGVACGHETKDVVGVAPLPTELHGQAVALDVELRELAFEGAEGHGTAALVLQALADVQADGGGPVEAEQHHRPVGSAVAARQVLPELRRQLAEFSGGQYAVGPLAELVGGVHDPGRGGRGRVVREVCPVGPVGRAGEDAVVLGLVVHPVLEGEVEEQGLLARSERA